MNPLETYRLSCPSCGEPVEIVVDLSVGAQRYVEDCQVCCAPMVVTVIIAERGGARPQVALEREGEG